MSERSTELKQYILKHKHLFWYTPEDKKVDVSSSLLVETILNYGRYCRSSGCSANVQPKQGWCFSSALFRLYVCRAVHQLASVINSGK